MAINMIGFKDERCLFFKFEGERNILDAEHLGIINGAMTAGTPHDDVLCARGLWAPPYVSSDFCLEIRIDGERVRGGSFTWYPFAVKRTGAVNGIEVESLFTFAAGRRCMLAKIRVKNTGDAPRELPVSAAVRGGMDYVHFWEFSTAEGTKAGDLRVAPGRWKKTNNDKALIVATDLTQLRWFERAGLWEGELSLCAGERKTFYFAAALDERASAEQNIEAIMAEPERWIDAAAQSFEREVGSMFAKLPVFESDSRELTDFYYRSLVHYFTNKWRAGEFVINPYYSTGGINGGCVGSYLWDFSAGWRIHGVYDPETIKNQLRRFLMLDLGKCFAFSPVDGRAFGPWYPVNHEKIIGLIYFYVKITGDAAFLSERVGEKTVLEWAVYHALYKDDASAPVSLVDYGVDGEHHLELRRGVPYHGILPDLNARRYMGYMRAYELTCLTGEPDNCLPERAERLKELINERLWNPENKWFDFLYEGGRGTRFTVQMFKLFSSPVLDEKTERGLLSHLNEDEFLSRFGLHSMSKKDAAYDQADIDNGGGGACSIFAPIISGKLYRAGHAGLADDILRRVLWWGQRVPYWGDSFTANYIDYRRDTPLQCTIGGVVGAECILFDMLGIDVSPKGDITLKPHCPGFCGRVDIKGLRLRGKTLDIHADREGFCVTCEGVLYRGKTGGSVVC